MDNCSFCSKIDNYEILDKEFGCYMPKLLIKYCPLCGKEISYVPDNELR